MTKIFIFCSWDTCSHFPKVWLDIAYLLSGPVIAVIAYLALGQIRIAKAQIEEQRNALRVTSKRDALKLTSEQVTLYCDKIIPLQNVFYKKMRDEGVDVFDKFGVEFDSESIKLIPPGEQVDIEVLGKFVTEFVNVANAMESFSTYFISGEGANKRGNSSRLTQSFHFFSLSRSFLP